MNDTEKKLEEVHAEYYEELGKLKSDPEHYVTPGARKYFRRVAIGYAILAIAIGVGLWVQQNEQDSRVVEINRSRAQVTYSNCNDTNERHRQTVSQLNIIAAERKERLQEKLDAALEAGNKMIAESARSELSEVEANKASTITLIDALQPELDCKQLIIERFGAFPEGLEK